MSAITHLPMASEPPPLWQMIERANDELRVREGEVVQRIQKGRNAPEFYGYLPQAILDAVSQVFGPDAWSYEEIKEHTTVEVVRDGAAVQATVKVRVTLRYGETTVIRDAYGTHESNSVGDALNSAVTHAIGKAFGRMGIGRDAYYGKLAEFADTVAKGGMNRPAPRSGPPRSVDRVDREVTVEALRAEVKRAAEAKLLTIEGYKDFLRKTFQVEETRDLAPDQLRQALSWVRRTVAENRRMAGGEG